MPTTNLLARVKGSLPLDSLFTSAHHDSTSSPSADARKRRL